MTLKFGEKVTQEYLENFFTKSVLEYNSLDYTQIASLTSGQVFFTSGEVNGDYFNIYSEQSYQTDADMDIFRYLRERVEKIEGRI